MTNTLDKNRAKQLIQFRPHHFMCTIGFQGMGYSPKFINNYQKIIIKITKNPNTLINIVKKQDDICNACPHLRVKTGCISASKVDAIDARHMELLGFEYNEVISWNSAKQIIKTRMTTEKFEYACNGCEWKSFGICIKALQNLHSE